MSCRDFDRYIQLYVDQEISEPDRRLLLEHTRTCQACRLELLEMVTLVSSFEDVREEVRPSPAPYFHVFFKWVAVCTAVFTVIYFVPWSPLFLRKEGGSTAQPVQHSVMVLAAQEERLPIPSNDAVRVVHPGKLGKEPFQSEATLVYPSALSYLLESKDVWEARGKQFVFVHVPDEQTLFNLLTYAGFKGDRLSELENITYPISVKVTIGEQFEYETFTFPESRQDIVDWFQELRADQVPHFEVQ